MRPLALIDYADHCDLMIVATFLAPSVPGDLSLKSTKFKKMP